MINNVISLGDKIDLWRINNKDNENQEKKVYKSSILDFIDEKNIKIAMPFEGTRIIPLDVGEKYTLCVYTTKGLYNCNCMVMQRYRQENLYVLEILLLTEFDKYQRREYYRLDCLIDTKYRIITKKEQLLIRKLRKNNFENDDYKKEFTEEQKIIQDTLYKGIIIDISGGGARINSDVLHEEGDIMLLKIPLMLEGTVIEYEYASCIVFSFKLPNRTGIYEHRIKFIDLSKEKREIIIKFVFEEERRIRRKEKGYD